MKEDHKKIRNMFLRYFILLLIAVPGLDLFYFLFLPLTKYPVFFGLKLFYEPVLLQNVIFVGRYTIEIVGACIAGSAYYFLLILNLSTARIDLKTRLKLVLTTFGAFFLINLVRIYVLSIMYLEGSPMFDATHKLFWYFGSTVFVVLIWFFGTYYFKVNAIPFYTDLKYMYSHTKRKPKEKPKRKRK
jgi:exosortase/archaeosortase family protein